jgi:hypothetical protein
MDDTVDWPYFNSHLLLDVFHVFFLVKDVHSKHEYFDQYLEIERAESNALNNKLFELKEEARTHLDIYDPICHQCWCSIYDLNYDYLSVYVLKNNKQIKQSYDDTLYPLQHFLFVIYYMNTISMSIIFETPFRLFCSSTLLMVVCLCIQAELFIADAPSVYYTLIIGICVFLFSIFLLLKIIITLSTVILYRIMTDILTNE